MIQPFISDSAVKYTLPNEDEFTMVLSERVVISIPKEEIAGNDYDMSINKYKSVIYETVEYSNGVCLDE